MTAPTPQNKIIARIPEQAQAADPAISAWVSANAGSGKTSVLADRVVRLLRAGTAPGRILCLTFTRAAAAEMANRVFAQLSGWAAANDENLIRELQALDGRTPSAKELVAARTLFAQALETPGGLKIQTIHAFCERVLHQFPFEANVAAHFKVIDEGTATELQQDAEREVLGKVADDPDGALAQALTGLMAYVGDATFSSLMSAVISARKDFQEWQRMAGGLQEAFAELADQMHLQPEDTQASIEADMLASPILPSSEWAATASVFETGSKSDNNFAAILRQALLANRDDQALRLYGQVYFTQAGKPRAKIMTKKLGEEYPELLNCLMDEQERLLELMQKAKARAAFDATHDLLSFGDGVLDAYTQRKQQSGRLDYDDLITKMRDLLTRQGAAAWVLYKLDGGIDHILIDEAQDTSPDQWEIVRLLSEEALSGEGARLLRRTIFAVGDEKQSIYSFQGAEPAQFDEMRRYFARRVDEAKGDWENVPLNLSFRSVPAILEAVDKVFEGEEARTGLSSTGDPVSHSSFRENQPGLVEIWPLAEVEPAEQISPWLAPLDRFDPDSPRAILAKRIADTILGWIETGETIAATGKAIRPGDILILVRRRDALVDALISALRQRRIQVAGADRLVLQQHIAVLDLLAAADFVLLPEDDLNLASLLKSPLIGLTEDDLFLLAYDRPGSLWQALRQRQNQPSFVDARQRLEGWLARADFGTPYGFFAEILGPGKGRKELHRRLGSEAIDVIDEFLNAVLKYEQVQTPSLQGFVHWMRAQSADIKRDMEHDANEVRIMTVHGAKGLEAPIVFLPDTCSVPGARNNPKLTRVAPPADRPHLPDRLVWSPGPSGQAPDIVSDARAVYQITQSEEYRRLLYVAMTRAKDRLYVCGHKAKNKAPDGCWYELVSSALLPLSVEQKDDDGEVSSWRYFGHVGNVDSIADQSGDTDRIMTDALELPPWIDKAALDVPKSPKPMTPSGGGSETDELVRSGKTYPDANIDGRRRGILIHRLLQELPVVPVEDREPTANRVLAAAAPELDMEGRAFLIKEALGVLEMPELAALFSAAARAEVQIVAELEIPDQQGARVSISAIIDRLAVFPGEVIVADFKTDRRVPDSPESVPRKYLVQLSVYVKLVKKIFPGKNVRAQLIWTAAPEIMGLPDKLLAGINWLEKQK